MSYSLDQLAADCHDAIARNQGPAGREEVCRHVERALADADFVETHLGANDTAPRRVLYEDPEFGFCILAHVYEGANRAEPHDHAGSWAIYGQAEGTTEMTEWHRVKPPEGDQPGLVEPMKVYELKPGMAVLYNEEQIHSPSREDSTRLIRIEGRNLAGVKRDRYQPAQSAQSVE